MQIAKACVKSSAILLRLNLLSFIAFTLFMLNILR